MTTRAAFALLCLALAGCQFHPASQSCVFGGATFAQDAVCAEKNFGKDGAAYIRERAMLCEVCGTTAGPEVGATEQYCFLNCRARP